MASQKTKFAVGLFITCGICIALVAFVWLGMSRFFEKGRHYVVYFNESVQGLDIDSPVKYRGVAVGRVEGIGVAPDSKLIKVILKIEKGEELTEDIVAQLKSVGITGSMFIELDRKKKGEPDMSPPLNFPSEYPIIASKPSNISQLLQGIDDVLAQIRGLDLKGISEKTQITLESISRAVTDANVKGISARIDSSLEDIGHIVKRERWDRIMASVENALNSIDEIMGKADMSITKVEETLGRLESITVEKEIVIKSAIDEFKRAMENSNIFLEKGTSLVGGTSDSLDHLSRHLIVIGQNLEKATENLNRLTEFIADQPSQLIFGDPPAPRELNK